MKIKTDFTTNSSSTSFVVSDARRGYKIPDFGDTLVVGAELGETQFGWGPEKISDVGSRINFAYLQTKYVNYGNKWLKMLEKVIKENTKVKHIIYNITEEYFSDDMDWGYIDHQSSAGEGMNTEIFASKNDLKDFLFGKDSYIQLDNDNH